MLVVTGLLLLSRPAQAQYDPDWSRHFRLGAMVGFNVKADFKMSGEFPISGSNPGETGVHGVDHFYDDGYVRVDNLNNKNGVTSYWGYDQASQYDSASQTLFMHSTTSFSTSGSSSSADAQPLPGLELAYGANFWYWHRLRIGWDLGVGFLPIKITDHESAPASVNQLVHSFDASGISVFPVPGYQGGPSGGGSALLNDIATAAGSTNSPGATLTGSQTLDVMLYTFRLGPTVYWDFSRYVGMSIGAGPALGVVSGELRYDETITAGGTPVPNKGHVSGTDLVYGGYVNAMVMIHVVRNGDIYFGAQYMPLGTATISGKGREGRLDLSGALYVSAGVNWPF